MVTQNDDQDIGCHSKMGSYHLTTAERFTADRREKTTPGIKPRSTILYNTFNP